jgi:hypothetical protein
MSIIDDALGILGTVAPGIATALGGPVAGLAVKALTSALGLPDTTSKDGALAALTQATPDQLLALKKADNDFMVQMRQLEIDLEKTRVDDRKDSRARAIAMHDWSPNLIGVLILGVWAWVNVTMLTMDKPPAIAGELVGRILGMIDSATLAFLYWIYGGSKTGDRLARDK